MCKKLICLTLLVMILSLCSAGLVAAPPPPPGLGVFTLFSNNAVLQRNINVPVWGTGISGNQVSVNFNGQLKSTTIDANGEWMVTLDPMSVNTNPGNMVITSGSNVITITNIQIGEVWVCSGQSNMLYGLGGSTGGAEAVADSINHNINYYNLDALKGDFSTTFWTDGNPDTAGDSYAIAWYFAHALQHWFTNNSQNMPIGLIQLAKGGSEILKWFHTNDGAQGEGELYEAKIMPAMPYAIRGVIWHQGEADGWPDRAPEYYWRMQGLISEWRHDWGQGDFPFILGQTHWHTKEEFAWVRDAQLHAFLMSDANVGMPVTCDWPDGSGHPPYKTHIGERMALFARKICYGDSLVYSGPIIDKANSYINGNQIVLAWNHVGGGLTTSDGNAPTPFKIAGSNGVYYDATAQIAGNTVVVSSASVSSPTSVRYIYNYGVGNLINVEGLPATPIMLDLVKEPDTASPKPTPMLWAEFPEAIGADSITMVAQPSYDYASRYEVGMVEYYFDETSGNPGGGDSTWQTSRYYTDTGLQQNTTYTYRVKIRDKSAGQNESTWSSALSATTSGAPDTTPPTPNPMTWATLPYATGSTSIAMVATTASDASGVEYYFDCTTTGGHDSIWQAGTGYTDAGLLPSTTYTYRVQARDKSPNQNATGWSMAQSATTQPSPSGTCHVGAIDLVGKYKGTGSPSQRGYYAQATITVHDQNHAVLSGATVNITWSGCVSGTGSGTTGTNGQVVLNSPINVSGGTFTCCVSNLTKSGYTYQSGSNHVTCGSIVNP